MKLVRMLGIVALLALSMQPGSRAAAPSSVAQAPVAEIEKADFFRPGFAPVRNNGSYDVTIVYFFDYQCPACRQYHADVSRALAEDRRVRVIYRDTPIFGPKSDAAAYAAIASQLQGRHEALHDALMSTKGPIDAAALHAAARKAGVDWDRLQRDMRKHESKIELLVARNFELAVDAGIHGTPAFIVGDSLANGALDYAGLKGEIADARKAQRMIAGTSAQPTAEKIHSAGVRQPDPEADRTAKPSTSDAMASAVFRETKAADNEADVMPSPSEHSLAPTVPWFAGAGAGALALAAAAFTWWRRRRRKA